MKPRALLALVVAAGCTLAAAPSAHADWERITSASSRTATGEVALLRLPDALHVVWRSTTASYRHRIDHRPIAPDGTVGTTSTITEDWLELSDPGLTAGADGLRVIFGGLRSAHPDEINTELNTAVSVDGGATWGLQEGSIVGPGTRATGSPVSAVTAADGLPRAVWANGTGTWIHTGLDPAVAPGDLQAPLGGTGTAPGIATVGARTVVAWFSTGAARGVYAAELAPGSVAAPMPGTSSTRSPMGARTPIAARAGGKVFIVYPTGNGAARAISLWSVGSATTRTIARAAGPSVAAVTADGAGRLWVAWTTRVGGRDRVLARRSNASATRFGPIVDAGRPPAGTRARTLAIDAAGDELDVLAGYTRGTSSRAATWYSRVAEED